MFGKKKNSKEGTKEYEDIYSKEKDDEGRRKPKKYGRWCKKTFFYIYFHSLGNITSTCKEMGISRQTYYKNRDKDPEVKQLKEDVAEIKLDIAEAQLMKLIQGMNVPALLFFLKTKGKKRGYIEKLEIDSSDAVPQEIKDEMTPLQASELYKADLEMED